ncbi:MAG TPA: ABC transporter permease [Gemmatimonadaceae bacterium]|nr:ABC transporter permease [Gemmatimonadaceae bacterium]
MPRPPEHAPRDAPDPPRVPAWRRYLRFWGPDVDADVDDELRFHLQMRIDDNLARGLAPEAARAEALERFGDVERVRAACRTIGHQRESAMKRTEHLATLRQDLRYAARTLRRAPGFTLAAVLSLALGIGANAAIFTLIDAVVLRPLPGIAHPEALVELSTSSISYPAYRDIRDESGAFAGFAGYRTRPMSLSTGDGASVISGGIVSGNYFPLLGVRAALGRTFAPDEDRPGSRIPAVVLSHGLWQRAFGGDSAVVGRTVRINAHPFTVIGVAPRGFRGTSLASAPDLWMTINAWPLTAVGSFTRLDIENTGWGWMQGVGRLAPGTTLAQAQARLGAYIERKRAAGSPTAQFLDDVTIVPARDAAVGLDGGPGLDAFVLLLGAAVGVALLIACANVANLLLARAARRQREISVRLALGAGRGRLVRQLLTESLLVALLGGVAALAVAAVGGRLLARVSLPGGVDFQALGTGLSPRGLGVVAALALLSVVLFGLAPALQASRPALAAELRGTGAAAGAGRGRLRDALVVAQLALCLVLLAGAGLFVRSLRTALAVDTGYDTERVAVGMLNLGLQRYDAERARLFYATLGERLARRPGVTAVSFAATLPLTGNEDVYGFALPTAAGDTATRTSLATDIVAPDYFRTVGLRLVRGREFTARDGPGAPLVAIVNETLARRYWPDGDAVGQRIGIDAPGDLLIVGVARDASYSSLGDVSAPHIYLPLLQRDTRIADDVVVLLRAEGDAAALVPELRAAVRTLDPDVPVLHADTFDGMLAEVLRPQRLAAALLGLFGGLTLVLAAVGIYGVMAYLVGQRAREIGVRIALGASARRVVGLVLGRSLVLVGTGVVLGLGLALAASRVVAGFLFGIGAADPWAMLGSTLLLAGVALVASYVPARRAAAIDPQVALRTEG